MDAKRPDLARANVLEYKSLPLEPRPPFGQFLEGGWWMLAALIPILVLLVVSARTVEEKRAAFGSIH